MACHHNFSYMVSATQMRNAKEELLEMLNQVSASIKCATITHCLPYNLPILHTVEESQAFFESLNFEYDPTSGFQELYGTIWFSDKTWAVREGYDGSGWWEYIEQPKIPKELYKMT